MKRKDEESIMKAMSKEATEFAFPPKYCSPMCRNSMNDLCVTECAINRDCSRFELKKGLEIADLPRFPLNEFLNAMTADERKVIMAVYMAKTTDYLQGVTNEPTYAPELRHNHDYSRSEPLSKNIPIQSVLHGLQESIPSAQTGKKHSSESIRPTTVDQPAD